MINITTNHQDATELLKKNIKELQEIAEELEESFPRLEEDDAKIINSLCRKLTDRLSSAHDISIKLLIQMERINNEH